MKGKEGGRERGKRKEEGGKREEERGKREEEFWFSSGL